MSFTVEYLIHRFIQHPDRHISVCDVKLSNHRIFLERNWQYNAFCWLFRDLDEGWIARLVSRPLWGTAVRLHAKEKARFRKVTTQRANSVCFSEKNLFKLEKK